MEQCLERPGVRENPSHLSQQGKVLVFSSPPLGIGRELFCFSPQRGGKASGIFQQRIAFVVQASVRPDWTSPLTARSRCPWRHLQQRCSGGTAPQGCIPALQGAASSRQVYLGQAAAEKWLTLRLNVQT